MSTPALEITAYTPLETLLLFYNLSTHGIHPTSFSLISNILVRNPLVKNGETFDRSRLAPDALKEFYLLQLREAELELGNGGDGQSNGDGGRQGSPATSRKKKAKTPPAALSNPDKTGVVKILTSRLYEKYRNTVFQQIRDDERRYAELERDISDISAGLWDERLLRENTAKVSSRSSSATPKSSKQKRVSSSPSLDRRNATPSVSPIAEVRNEPSATNVSVEVSPRALPAARTPTVQQAVPQPATQRSPQLKSSLPLRPNNHSAKSEQQSAPKNATDRQPRNVPVPAPLPQQSPPPHARDQVQEGQKESYMPLAQTKRDVMKAASTPTKTQPAAWSNQAIQTASSSPRQTQTHRALAAPIPSPQVPQKMEVIPPPPPSSTSSPVAPPSRPGVKIEAPVPPPTRTPFPPITPRPMQGSYTQPQNTLSRPPSVPGSGQGPQGLTGLQQLADVADTRWQQQQHTPPYVQHGAPPGQHIAYSSPGQSASYGPAPISPNIHQGHRTSTPSTPGATGGFGVLFPTPLPTTPGPSAQQYSPQFSPQNQARQAGVQPPGFQHYNPHVAAQQQQQNFEQVPPVPSPTVRIAPRPPAPAPSAPPPQVAAVPIQQPNAISPSKTRPPPIVTSTGSTEPFPQSPGHKGEPGSPIPPRPDEISPISTPSRSPPPPPESPKLVVSIEKPRGRKRLFPDDGKSPQDRRKSGGVKENTKARAERAKEDKPVPKRQKKHEKTPAKSPIARRGSVIEKEVGAVLPVPENRVKDEEADATEVESDAPVSIVDEEEKPQKPRGRGRPRGKAKPPPPPPEEQVEAPVKEKRTKRKRTELNAPTSQTIDEDEEDSGAEVASVSPTPQRRSFPKLENQGSNLTNPVPSPSPLTAMIGQQPLVVATKKFLQLSAPLLSDISSHKFANLFSHAVNERMAPGYRNLVFRPQDLKSIKAAVKSGTAAITNTSTGTPAMTPTTDFAAATPPAASSSTFATLPATTLNTPPKGIVNSVQLEKELFRMFANAIMYNKSTTEIGKETVVMARDVEGMVDNFRTAEEAGMKKALGAAATGGGFGSARKGGVRDRERETTAGTAGDEEQSVSGDKGDDGDGDVEDSVMGDTDGASEKGKGKAIAKRKRLKR